MALVFALLAWLYGTLVLPPLIDMTAERGHFDFVKRHIRSMWMLFFVISTAAVLQQADIMEIAMKMHRRWKSEQTYGYVVFAVVGAAVFCGYWWFVGKALAKTRAAIAHLEFKYSPLITASTKESIVDAVGGYFEFLKEIGIEIPPRLPPVGVYSGSDSTGSSYHPSEPISDNIMIGENKLKNPRDITMEFSEWLVGSQLMGEPMTSAPKPNTLLSVVVADTVKHNIAGYLNFSYWEEKAPTEGGGWIDVFWDIREKFGNEFADKLAAKTLEVAINKQARVAMLAPTQSKEFERLSNEHFYRYLMVAEEYFDNQDAKLEEVNTIIGSHGLLPQAAMTPK
jgi:hypothetical protein